MPIGDPDLWWHLGTARWMLTSGAWPVSETLSFTRAGAAWTDFEWLSQLVLYAVHAAGGLTGLWAFKAAALALVAAAVSRLLSFSDAPPPARAMGLALWAAAMLPRSDIRTELFSLIAFSWLLVFLETRRRDRRAAGIKTLPLAAASLAAFALWANLHAGFIYGLGVLLLYAMEELADKRPPALAAAAAAGAAGTLLNPYGFRLHAVLWQHVRDAPEIGGLIAEWSPLSLARAVHWPAWVLLAVAAAAFLTAWGRGRPVRGAHAVGIALFGMAMLRHARVLPFFAAMAVPYLFLLGARGSRDRATAPRAPISGAAVFCAALLMTCGAFSTWAGWGSGLLRKTHHQDFLPVRAAAFIGGDTELAALRLYNPWGWGGYLGWKGLRIFQDGRYLFHDLLAEAGDAVASPREWQAFLAKRGVQAALMENLPLKLPMTRSYPDGGTREFQRPHYLSYMPREHWALIYWDEKSLLFLRRDAVGAERLKGLEFRIARPGDDEALGDVLSRGEVDEALLRSERLRHARLLSSLPARP